MIRSFYNPVCCREEKEKILNRLRRLVWITRSHSDPNDDVIMDDNDRSVPIVTRTEHQLYEDKQEVSHITLLKLSNSSASNASFTVAETKRTS